MASLALTLEKQENIIQLLKEELKVANDALEKESQRAAALEKDFENVLDLLQNRHLQTKLPIRAS